MVSLFGVTIVYIVSYMICELNEVKHHGAANQFTFVSKTIQILLATPIYIFYSFLIVKFCKMSIYLYKRMSGLEEADRAAKVILITIAVIFIIHYLMDVFYYVYPYILLNAYK